MDKRDEVTGMVIDVEQFALHDGPGIRTTVFLKGCPLRCVWCHNPESASSVPERLYQYDKCIDCVGAGYICPFGVRPRLGDAGDDVLHDRHDGELVDPAECPHGAVRTVGRLRTVESVMSDVVQDTPFYECSNGGMTVSGGEPMQQFDFTLALLSTAKTHGIHTCLDTSGCCSMKLYKAVLPYVDLFLYDYKATSPDKHRRLTGVSNERIIDNLNSLISLGANVLLRCPLIPGINDDDEHLSAISQMSAKFPQLVGIEIMPFHDLARGKWRSLGRPNPLPGLKTADDKQKALWAEKLSNLGTINLLPLPSA